MREENILSTLSRCSFRVVESLSIELALTGKPGLVTVDTPNIHKDMDFLFMTNSFNIIGMYYLKLSKFITDIYKPGKFHNFKNIKKIIEDNYEDIINIGVDFEKKLFDSNNGVNTYKGVVFSFGIAALTDGFYYTIFETESIDIFLEEYFDILKIVSNTVINLKNKSGNLPSNSYGARLREYNKKDISYIADSGYSIIKEAYEIYKKLNIEIEKIVKYLSKNSEMVSDMEINEINYQLKLYLIFAVFFYYSKEIDDSTIIGKSSIEISDQYKKMSLTIFTLIINSFNNIKFEEIAIDKNVKKSGKKIKIFEKNLTNKMSEINSEIKKMEKFCKIHKISPGGSADLLALTIYFLKSCKIL